MTKSQWQWISKLRGGNNPLASVVKKVDKGDMVHFGAKKEDNYIMNVKSGNKFLLTPNGKGSYLMEVKLLGGEKTNITVDSGAEENVCPPDWGYQFGLVPPGVWMDFRNAIGDNLPHYGQREVKFGFPF